MAIPFANEYHLRTVADISAKSCLVCFKPSSKVLITPNNKDFFYICANHLLDRGFASPKVDPKVEAEKREKEALQHEIDLVKKEYEEKQKKKGKKKTELKKKEDDGDADEKERDDKIKSLETRVDQNSETGPRVFILQKCVTTLEHVWVLTSHRDFYTMRLDRLRTIEASKRQQARIRDPSLFPSAPAGDVADTSATPPP